MKKRDAEQQVIATARLVYLAWVGDTVDGGKAMREQLIELGKTFAVLDAVATHGNGYGPPKPCRWCGKLRPTCKDGSLRNTWCDVGPRQCEVLR